MSCKHHSYSFFCVLWVQVSRMLTPFHTFPPLHIVYVSTMTVNTGCRVFFVRLVQGGFFDASVCDLTDLRFHIFLYNKAGFIPGSDSLKMSPLLFLLYEILTSVCCQTEVSYQISYLRRLDQNTYTKRKRPDWILALYYRRITLKGQVSWKKYGIFSSYEILL